MFNFLIHIILTLCVYFDKHILPFKGYYDHIELSRYIVKNFIDYHIYVLL